MNTCPVYRRSGGHSYGTTIPGPIGSILTPGFDLEKHSDLPFASTLCGSCSDVCPVKIPIHEQLYRWRQVVSQKNLLPYAKKKSMSMLGYTLSKPGLYRVAGKLARLALKRLPRRVVYNPFNLWGKGRELPKAPPESFREWYVKRKNESRDE